MWVEYVVHAPEHSLSLAVNIAMRLQHRFTLNRRLMQLSRMSSDAIHRSVRCHLSPKNGTDPDRISFFLLFLLGCLPMIALDPLQPPSRTMLDLRDLISSFSFRNRA